MGELAFHIVVILDGNVHEVAPVGSVACTLFRFVQDVAPHLLSRTVLDVDFPTSAFVCDEEKSGADVFSFLFGAQFSVYFKPDGGLVVLVNDIFVNLIALSFNEV